MEKLTITEAAERQGVTRQAVYVAVKAGRLKASKPTAETRKWMIVLGDLEEYTKNKYSRANSKYKGELTFDRSKGEYSVSQAAEFLGVPAQKVYYATRIGILKANRKGAAWVIHIADIQEFQERHLPQEIEKKAV
jgi:excisionase family DNA binding protein